MDSNKDLKTRLVVVSFYIPGIYPPGEDSVVLNLLAPAYLKAAVDSDPELSAKYETIILDVPTNAQQEEVLSQIRNYNPKIVLYSVYIWNYNQALSNSRLLKNLMPDTHLIMGGPQVSYNAEDLLKENPQVDAIVKGSGELIFKMILQSDLSPKSYSEIPSLAYRDNGKIMSSTGSIQEDLSKVPSPYQTGAINLNDGRRHTVCMELSRGCVFRCQYCVWGDRNVSMRKFPLQQLLKDIEIIYNSPNVAVVYFVDSCIFYMRDYAEKIIDKITECKYKNIPTVLTLDARVLNEGMIRYLQKINLIYNQYQFGLQAVNTDTLKIVDRYYVKEKFKEKIDLLRKVNPEAEIGLDIMFGLPGDNYDKFRETVDFAFKLKASKIYPSPLLLLPGTPFFQDRDKYGFKADDNPPYMAISNNTYSKEDMQKTFSFVLWVLGIMYFPALRSTIAKISEYNLKYLPVELIDKFIEIM